MPHFRAHAGRMRWCYPTAILLIADRCQRSHWSSKVTVWVINTLDPKMKRKGGDELVRRAQDDCGNPCCCWISHETDQIKQLLHIYILSQAPYPDSSLTVTPSWLNFPLFSLQLQQHLIQNSAACLDFNLPKNCLFSCHPLPCSLHWLLTWKVSNLDTKGTPPRKKDRPGQPFLSTAALGSICDHSLLPLPAPPAWPEKFVRPGFPMWDRTSRPRQDTAVTPWLILWT